jgi:hypothetical protein
MASGRIFMAKQYNISLLLAFIVILAYSSLCFAYDYNYSIINTQNITIQSDSKSISVTNQKSPTKAFLFSAAVPGTGELYVGSKKGFAFIVSEIAFWSAYIVLHGRSNDLRDNYTDYVDTYIAFEEDSPATSTKDWTLEDYEHATQTNSWHYVYTESNGQPIERIGKFYWKDLQENWQDLSQEEIDELVSKYRAEAYSIRGSANKKSKQAKICLSMLVLNHVVSAIDARVSAIMKAKNPSQTTNISVHTFMSSNASPGLYAVMQSQF